MSKDRNNDSLASSLIGGPSHIVDILNPLAVRHPPMSKDRNNDSLASSLIGVNVAGPACASLRAWTSN